MTPLITDQASRKESLIVTMKHGEHETNDVLIKKHQSNHEMTLKQSY